MRALPRIQSADPVLNRLQDELKRILDPLGRDVDGHATRLDALDRHTRGWLSVAKYGTDQASIVAAEAAAYAAGSVLYFPEGEYTATSALTFRVPVRSSPKATITTTYTAGPAITIGDGTTYMNGAVVELPNLVGTRVWAAGSPGADVGVRLTAINNGSEIRLNRIANFSVGVLAEGGDGKGFAYNRIFLGHLENCLVPIDLHPTLTGWVNENQWFGGRLSMSSSEGIAIAGSRKIRLRKHVGSAINGPNNNIFTGGSLEGNGAEYHVEITGGAHNRFIGMRWESSLPTNILLDGADTVHNTFDGGYESSEILVTVANGAIRNTLHRDGAAHSIEGTVSHDGSSVLELRNTNGAAKGVLQIMPTGVSPLATGRQDGDWVARFTGEDLSFKAPTEAYPRVTIGYTNGQIKLGAGNAAPAAAIKGTADSIRFLGTGLARIGFETDNVADIGGGNSLRPRAVFVGTYVQIGGDTVPGGAKIYSGSGAPGVSAPVGSLYLRTDGGAGTTLYVKESGTDATGWVPK